MSPHDLACFLITGQSSLERSDVHLCTLWSGPGWVFDATALTIMKLKLRCNKAHCALNEATNASSNFAKRVPSSSPPKMVLAALLQSWTRSLLLKSKCLAAR